MSWGSLLGNKSKHKLIHVYNVHKPLRPRSLKGLRLLIGHILDSIFYISYISDVVFTEWVGPLVEQELFTLPEHMSSSQVFLFCLVRVAQSLAFCVVFCRSLFVFLLFFYFEHLIFWPSFFGFWHPHWYLKFFFS